MTWCFLFNFGCHFALMDGGFWQRFGSKKRNKEKKKKKFSLLEKNQNDCITLTSDYLAPYQELKKYNDQGSESVTFMCVMFSTAGPPLNNPSRQSNSSSKTW